MIRLSKTSAWGAAIRAFGKQLQCLGTDINRAMYQEAHLLRNLIVKGLTDQAPGGQTIKPLSGLTLASRRLQGFRGTKALVKRADLRNSIAVVPKGDICFVGVLRRVDREGKDAVDLAHVHEFGTDPVLVRITPAMRRYLSVLLREAGIQRAPGLSASKGYILIKVPARPFLRPAHMQFKKNWQARYRQRIASFWSKT